MRRFTAGQTITVTAIIAGAGALTDETFKARAYGQGGYPMEATAAITDAAAREVTITVAADEWRANSGGYGRLELLMVANGETTAVLSEEFRIMLGLSVTTQHPYSDYRIA